MDYVLPRLERFPKGAYQPIAQRLAGVRRTSASKRGWGSGWPDCQMSKLVGVEANRLGGGRFRQEIAPLVEFLLKASNALGYDIRKTAEPDGGFGTFSCRAIKNSDPQVASNHSWGLALDQNTKSNPMSKTWTSTTPPKIVDLWESAGFFWGGRYPVPQWYYDPMHLEYMGRPENVAQDLENAKAAFARLGGTSLYPVLRKGSPNRAMVRVLQFRLNAHGALLPETGDFLDMTDQAVRQFQRNKGLTVDGSVGPKTWTALNATPSAGGGTATPDPDPEPEPVEPPADEDDAIIARLEDEVAVLKAENMSLQTQVNELAPVAQAFLEVKAVVEKQG